MVIHGVFMLFKCLLTLNITANKLSIQLFCSEWRFVYNCIQHERIFFLNFNSYFEAKKILKTNDNQKQLLWSFHAIY